MIRRPFVLLFVLAACGGANQPPPKPAPRPPAPVPTEIPANIVPHLLAPDGAIRAENEISMMNGGVIRAHYQRVEAPYIIFVAEWRANAAPLSEDERHDLFDIFLVRLYRMDALHIALINKAGRRLSEKNAVLADDRERFVHAPEGHPVELRIIHPVAF
ncbi:MAG: hypothetical protein IT381_01010 [Deltaproteobacteria bacterium]|nr:hypothetical protein [Deltaproteobacteria bacterium]